MNTLFPFFGALGRISSAETLNRSVLHEMYVVPTEHIRATASDIKNSGVLNTKSISQNPYISPYTFHIMVGNA